MGFLRQVFFGVTSNYCSTVLLFTQTSNLINLTFLCYLTCSLLACLAGLAKYFVLLCESWSSFDVFKIVGSFDEASIRVREQALIFYQSGRNHFCMILLCENHSLMILLR